MDEFSDLFSKLKDKEQIGLYVAIHNFFLQTNQRKYLAKRGLNLEDPSNMEFAITDKHS